MSVSEQNVRIRYFHQYSPVKLNYGPIKLIFRDILSDEYYIDFQNVFIYY